MQVNEVPQIVYQKLDEFGLKDWKFQWDTCSKRFGSCYNLRKVITLSRPIVELNCETNPEEVIDTILHEIAHALAGPGTYHGPKWIEMCHKTGARPERLYDAKDVTVPKGRYNAKCNNCGREFTRHRPFTVKNKFLRCPRCGPELGRLAFRMEGEMPVAQREPEIKPEPVDPPLRVPQARLLQALMPDSPTAPHTDWPLLNKPMLAVQAGYTAISGSVTRALHGIYPGSSSGEPHPGALTLGLIETLDLDIDGVIETNYRITKKGIAKFQSFLSGRNKPLPEVKPPSVCTNIRYVQPRV